LVCDEPVSALDVSIHAQILNLLLELQEKLNLTYVFISHNLADVKKMCDHLAVMYLGKVMEAGNSDKIFANPMHPYTQALIAAILDIDFSEEREIIVLPGDTPSPINPPSGCRFWQRCPKAMRGCREVPPEYVEVEPDHFVACHLVNGFPDQELPEGYDQPMVPREKVPGR
jgi:oligopeptide/dipeptide ABC transporter ATP-binding protein